MKQCPRCGQSYSDPDLNFCLNDGEYLTDFGPASKPFDDSQPTVMMDPTRVTNPMQGQWQTAPPPAPLQQSIPVGQGFAAYGIPAGSDQTLAVVSLCLGIGSLTIGWCCSLGLLLSPAALITGFIAISQTKKNPQRYGGRGFAIGGISTGGVFLALYVAFILIYGLLAFFSLLTGGGH